MAKHPEPLTDWGDCGKGRKGTPSEKSMVCRSVRSALTRGFGLTIIYGDRLRFRREHRMIRALRLAAPAAALLTALTIVFAAQAQTFEEAMAAYRSGDYETAYPAFRSLAERGDRRAQGSLGDMYRKGYGVAQDHAEAVKWYRRAADQGSAYAQNSLGLMYRDGLGVPRDAERAYMWFDLAVRNFPASRSNWRESAARSRDRVAASLSPQTLERARRMAEDWRPGAVVEPAPETSPASVFGVSQQQVLALVAIILIVLALATIFFLVRRRSRRGQRKPAANTFSAPAAKAEPAPLKDEHRVRSKDAPRRSSSLRTRPVPPEVDSVISGKAYVTDGDGLRVSRYTVRLAGLDAPELGQRAKDKSGRWIDHGALVKNELWKLVGGKHVRVVVEGYDQYDRVVGTVICDDKDVGNRLVRSGYAFSAYDDRYEAVEREARRAKRGLWGFVVYSHPSDERQRRNPERG